MTARLVEVECEFGDKHEPYATLRIDFEGVEEVVVLPLDMLREAHWAIASVLVHKASDGPSFIVRVRP